MSNMIENPEGYFKEFIPTRDNLLIELEEEARQKAIPIVGPVVGELLYILARATQAKQILELGTATGYSTIFLAKACESAGGKVITLEKSTELAERARSNFKKAGLADRIDVISGDAPEIMRSMKEPVDFIFLDIDKDYYFRVLDQCRRLLKTGGLLIADNVGFKDADKFNRAIFDDPSWRAIHLLSFLPFHSPEKDGLSLALRL